MKNIDFWSNLERNYIQNLEPIQKSGTVKFKRKASLRVFQILILSYFLFKETLSDITD